MLEQHSLFTQKSPISTKSDLTKDQIEKYGDKIIIDIPLSRIISQPQVRQSFEEKNIKELAEDIELKGLIHPITVMKHPEIDDKYILLIGGNRFLAFKYLNKPSIPSIIKNYTKDDTHLELLQLAENMHRTDLNTIELANAIMKIKEKTGYTLANIAKLIGRNVDSIKQYSRISKLSNKEKDHHIKNKSTKNDILIYLAKKDKETIHEFSEPLFKSTQLNPYTEIKKPDLIKKIKEAEDFLKIAKKIIKDRP
ncbi:hypothetical protein DID78_04505 [Candidatus Marinamargulisbacteria bacterium SCGC AG-343-D04]|nr:hypothetical protein DID78_04505 [Candidatus Marinamargulisbacteria bacterium SCGC AG-343-D04]